MQGCSFKMVRQERLGDRAAAKMERRKEGERKQGDLRVMWERINLCCLASAAELLG